jgi:hypothetical protein
MAELGLRAAVVKWRGITLPEDSSVPDGGGLREGRRPVLPKIAATTFLFPMCHRSAAGNCYIPLNAGGNLSRLK